MEEAGASRREGVHRWKEELLAEEEAEGEVAPEALVSPTLEGPLRQADPGSLLNPL